MAATNYYTLNDICYNLIYQIEGVVGLELVIAAITALQAINPGWGVFTITQADRNDMLRKLTGCTVATLPDINCYPRGEVETRCYDLDGMPIP